ncbi:hypothetical protein Nepgr_014237 [Nepenthes gracilis]|uniref:Uncharacterized protein n=1 Tax=Nepenthes gracilis TaxID=150966 RepID=A0AAD3SKN0_NEPGR|nr:hypothetical protein Nepgr_014237 [Nepenthes gracilis]
MGRAPCCAKEGLNRGAWTAAEDKLLIDHINKHGEGRWRSLPEEAGLKRCGKSCRLRWLNYLSPDIKRGNITPEEEDLIIRLHKLLGNRWSLIAGRLPRRTDNEIKNYWNSILGKKAMGEHTENNNKNKRASFKQSFEKLPETKATELKAVRTKATRCTKVFITPYLHNTEHLDQNTSILGTSFDRRMANHVVANHGNASVDESLSVTSWEDHTESFAMAAGNQMEEDIEFWEMLNDWTADDCHFS